MDERNPAAIILDSVRFFNRQGNEDVLALEETVNCKLFVNPIDKVDGLEYSISSRTNRVLKQKTNSSTGGAQNHETDTNSAMLPVLRPLQAERLAEA